MKILIYKNTTDADLSKGLKVCYKDINGEFNQIGIINEITEEDGVKLYGIKDNIGLYAANELKLISPIVLSYCEYSNTLRQFPENYLIAHFVNGHWICEPDLAADKDLCIKVFTALLEFDNKYQKNGLKLLAELTPAN